MKPIIRVEHLSKQYRIGASVVQHQNLREVLSVAFRSPLRRLRGADGETIWALKDVSFEVAPGEVLGLIGKNGAGKSTLLKVLSRITEPTSGRVQLYGRIGSLLEVGTGFHPELTGRENVFLNGAILGMRRAEIARKFDEIVAFSEIEKFIDTPVKHYSSGMYLRLAFSVAAHLEPEILILDEVLAVGDVSFQHKCLNKMHEIRRDGRTIIFVSHNLQAVMRLCRRVIYLSDGGIVDDGPAHEIATRYLTSRLNTSGERIYDSGAAPGNEIVRLRAVRVRGAGGEVSASIDIRQPVGIEMEFEVLEPGRVLVPNYHFMNEEGGCVFVASDHDPDWRRRPRPAGRYVSTAWIPGNFLAEGILSVMANISTLDPVVVHVSEEDAVAFQIVDSLDGDSARGDFAGQVPGVVRPLLPWTTVFEPRPQAAAVAERNAAV